MRQIVKGKEPAEWIAHRQTPGARYESKPCLREALYVEQGGICAYCMQRLKDELNESVTTDCINHERKEDTNNRIDHIKCRTKHPDLELVYTNMVMTCKGFPCNKSKDKAIWSCDKKKNNEDIHFSPLEVGFIESLSYHRSNGTILSTNADCQKDMNSVLNLNNASLMSHRVATLKAIKKQLGTKTWKASEFKKLIAGFDNRDADGLYAPFCGMIVWYLKKKLTAYG